MLDVGAGNDKLRKCINGGVKYTGIDIDPPDESIIRMDAHAMDFPDNSFDTVIAQASLEHLTNPIKVICDMKRIAKKQVIVSIPYRFLLWCKDHYWGISPRVLKHYLGEPESEKIICLRNYVGEWRYEN